MKEKTKKSEKIESTSNDNEKILQDPRFAHLVNDPRYKQLPQSQKKVKIDKRFESMFSNEKFKIKYTIDKYGRKVNSTSTEDLKKYYDLNEDDDSDEDDDDKPEKKDENDKLEVEEEVEDDLKTKLLDKDLDYARGHIMMSDSSSEEESTDDENDELFLEHVWGELDRDAPRTDESTYRLAACNMDWDRIRAIDIMVLCNSFLPSTGTIKSVVIYPSEFGKERMAEEDEKGPKELREYKEEQNDSSSDDDDDKSKDDDEEGSSYHMEKLRQYQLNRLKYYYAVITCDSVSTADKLYEECDGLEYESTATKFDLRFIPDDITFDNDIPKDECNAMPDMSRYQPRLFTTTALQQSKVELTWDENDISRKEINEKLGSGKLNEITDAELKKYIAYSSEEDEDNDNSNNKDKKEENDSDDDNDSDNSISKYRALLQGIQQDEDEKKKNKIEREMTWGINNSTDKTDKIVEENKNLTPFEKIIEKKKEKQKTRRIERKKRLGKIKNSDSDSDDESPDEVDMSDPYFAEEFANGEFEEPKTSKSKKQKSNEIENDSDEERRQKAELELLLDDGDDDNHENGEKSHFSLKKIMDAENETKSKRKRRKQLKKSKKEINEIKHVEIEDNFKINPNDERFGAIYKSHLFNIDPTDPHFKKTKGMEKIIEEKLKKRKNYEDDYKDTANDGPPETKKKKDVAVSMLVKSIKRKVGGGI